MFIKEYTVLKDGQTWTDRFDNEYDAISAINSYQAKWPNSKFEYREMTKEEMDKYHW